MLFIQENDFWVKEFDLTFGDKRALERDGAMLTDKHIIYAAHKLLWIQFPHLQGCHSTLLLQLKKFPSVTSVECSGNNLICTCKSLSYYRHVFIFVFFYS